MEQKKSLIVILIGVLNLLIWGYIVFGAVKYISLYWTDFERAVKAAEKNWSVAPQEVYYHSIRNLVLYIPGIISAIALLRYREFGRKLLIIMNVVYIIYPIIFKAVGIFTLYLPYDIVTGDIVAVTSFLFKVFSIIYLIHPKVKRNFIGYVERIRT
jgi:ABC-type Fe3+ transport system permease subunit